MKHLTKEQRYQIKACLNCGRSKFFIAEALKVDKTTIYRELKRNSKKRGRYDPGFAHGLSTERKERFASNRKFTLLEKYMGQAANIWCKTTKLTADATIATYWGH